GRRDHHARPGEQRDAVRLRQARRPRDELQVIRDGAARRVHRLPDRLRDRRLRGHAVLLGVRADRDDHHGARREAHAGGSGMNEILSATAFDWFLSAVTGIFAGLWLVLDAIKLVRLRRADTTDPVMRDKRFGYVMGVLIGAIGVSGVIY